MPEDTGYHHGSNMHHMPHHRHRGPARLKLVIAVIIVIAIILIAAAALGIGAGAIPINGSTKLVLNQTPTVISLNGHEYIAYLSGTSAQLKSATIYIKGVPVFASAAYGIRLVEGNSTHVNLDSSYSDIAIALDSINGSKVTVTATPVDLSLAISPNTNYIQMLPQSLFGVPSTLQSSSPATTTTIPQGTGTGQGSQSNTVTTTIAPSTTAPTTTVAPSQNQTLLKINTVLKASPFYGPMQNYTAAYATANAKCDYASYNTAYSENNNGAAPSGPASYYNVTAIVPYNMTMNITSIGHGNYSITYRTISHNPETTGPALQLNVNVSQSTLYSSSYTGVFAGQTTSSLESDYAIFSAKGVCGVYLV